MSRRKITMLTDALMGSAGAQNATRQVGVLVAPDSVDYVLAMRISLNSFGPFRSRFFRSCRSSEVAD